MPSDKTASPCVSVIIPVVNEAAQLPQLLYSLNAQRNIDIEVIVSDGGSTDGTPELAVARDATVVSAARGRGMQMNAGARQARGDYLLFLHADSGIANDQALYRALTALQEAIQERGHHRVGGHFRLTFKRSGDGHRLAYRYLEEKTAFNRPYTANGDQGFLLSKRFFDELGGFDESLPFLEDQRLAEKIRARGLWITLPGILETSARRFEAEGFYQRYILMALIMGLHYGGVEEFFERAPEVYRLHHQTGRLLLTPFFRLIGQTLKDRGWRESLRAWLRVGRFVRQNSWQLSFFLDVLARPLWGPGRYPALFFHDRVFWLLTHFRGFDVVMAVMVFIAVMGVLQPYFWVRERRQLGLPRKRRA